MVGAMSLDGRCTIHTQVQIHFAILTNTFDKYMYNLEKYIKMVGAPSLGGKRIIHSLIQYGNLEKFIFCVLYEYNILCDIMVGAMSLDGKFTIQTQVQKYFVLSTNILVN